jgi:hypothetical protein
MKLHSEERHDLCSLPNIIGDKIEKKLMGKACATSGGNEPSGIWWVDLKERHN